MIKTKNEITAKICDLCTNYNIKLIYISSLQVYKKYGTKDINNNSIIDLSNSYARSHYESEKIILRKFRKNKKMFTILRLGNVFGFKKYSNLNELSKNIIHDFCKSAISREKITVKNAQIQRQFIPSQIFVQIINKTINKKILNNSIINVGYKFFNLKEISLIIQERYEKIFNSNIKVVLNNFKEKIKNLINLNKNYKFKFDINKIYSEIDQVLHNMKRNKS